MKFSENPTELCAAGFAHVCCHPALLTEYPIKPFSDLVDFPLIQKHIFYSHFGVCTRKARTTCSGTKQLFNTLHCYSQIDVCVQKRAVEIVEGLENKCYKGT